MRITLFQIYHKRMNKILVIFVGESKKNISKFFNEKVKINEIQKIFETKLNFKN